METIADVFKKMGITNKPFDISDFGGLGNDEYLKDEVIYCKKCNTPRMFVSPDGSFKARCLCKCQTEARDREEARKKEIARQKEIDELKSASLLGERYRNALFETTETGHNADFDTAYIRCKRYCEVADEVLKGGFGIYIYGNKGTGKTHLTACMANALINQRKQVLFTNFFEVSKMLRSTFGKTSTTEMEYINKLASIDFLFLDDLGTERVQTKDGDLWLQEKIFDVLNKRYNNRKPTIFTSNYSLSELVHDRGLMDKSVDRIAEMSNVILKIDGDSYRMKIRKAELPF